MVLSRTGRPLGEAVFGPAARLLVRLGVSADAVTVTATVLTITAAVTLLPAGHLAAGALTLGLLVVADNLDGQIARSTGTASDWGAFLDATMDRLADAAIFGALAFWAVFHVPGTAGTITAVAAVACAALAQTVSYAKARAEAQGFTANIGLAERADRLVVTLVATLGVGLGLPTWVLSGALVLLAVASAVTVAQRVLTVRRQWAARAGRAHGADEADAPDGPGGAR